MANTRFAYIAGYLKETVTDSQIISWLERYQANGIIFDLILITGIRRYFKDKSSRRIKLLEARKRLSGRFYDVLAVKTSLTIGQIMVFITLLFIFLRDFLNGTTIIVQTRSASTTKALRWLKAVYPKLKVVYDIRGATAEEYINSYRQNALPLSKEIEKVYQFKLNQELSFVDVCDTAFCVSNKLKDYYLGKNDFNPDKFQVVPSCADENLFFVDEAARDRIRKELGITADSLVLLYSGGLDKSWQIPDFVFDVFVELKKRNDRLFFLCLTPHQRIVDEFVEKRGINRSDIWSGYIPYQDINSYLNAADFGFLFREDNVTNNVASPTKFAEYLMAGLPTVISKGIGDFSEFVATTPDAGVVVDNNSETLIGDIVDYLSNTRFDKNVTAAIGKRNFSKAIQLDKILGNFRFLQSNT